MPRIVDYADFAPDRGSALKMMAAVRMSGDDTKADMEMWFGTGVNWANEAGFSWWPAAAMGRGAIAGCLQILTLNVNEMRKALATEERIALFVSDDLSSENAASIFAAYLASKSTYCTLSIFDASKFGDVQRLFGAADAKVAAYG